MKVSQQNKLLCVLTLRRGVWVCRGVGVCVRVFAECILKWDNSRIRIKLNVNIWKTIPRLHDSRSAI